MNDAAMKAIDEEIDSLEYRLATLKEARSILMGQKASRKRIARSRGNSVTDAEIAKFFELRSAGKTYQEIAIETGRGMECVWRYLNRDGRSKDQAAVEEPRPERRGEGG